VRSELLSRYSWHGQDSIPGSVIFFSFHSVQTDSGAHLTFQIIDIGELFAGGKVTGA
jgi:hypothetical protein